jgi:lysozyme family protein
LGQRLTDRYFWAASFRTYGIPCDLRVGAIACYDGHVNIVDEVIDADTFWGVGGNQGSPNGGAVTRSKRSRSSVVALRWPNEEDLAKANLSQWSLSAKPGDASTTTVRPLISRKLASTGGFVTEAQKLLSVTPSGIFDDALDAAVRAFQRQRGLDVDGEVGPDTWRALLGANVTIAGDVPHAAEYLADWAAMAIEPEHADDVDRFAHQAFQNKARYQAAVAGTSVPWWFVAGCHLRESTFDFTANIHNGQRLGQVTTLAPAGRGPFATFEASVRDWIALKALDKITSWSLAQAAYRWELNNGMGYRNHGVPSAYLWSFCSIYHGGKYIADATIRAGHPNMPRTSSAERDAAPASPDAELDSTITFDDDPNRKPPMTDISQPTPNPPPANSVLIPPSQSILHQIIAAAVQAELDDLKRHPEKVTALLGKIASGAKLLGRRDGRATARSSNRSLPHPHPRRQARPRRPQLRQRPD